MLHDRLTVGRALQILYEKKHFLKLKIRLILAEKEAKPYLTEYEPVPLESNIFPFSILK